MGGYCRQRHQKTNIKVISGKTRSKSSLIKRITVYSFSSSHYSFHRQQHSGELGQQSMFGPDSQLQGVGRETQNRDEWASGARPFIVMPTHPPKIYIACTHLRTSKEGAVRFTLNKKTVAIRLPQMIGLRILLLGPGGDGLVEGVLASHGASSAPTLGTMIPLPDTPTHAPTRPRNSPSVFNKQFSALLHPHANTEFCAKFIKIDIQLQC